MITKQWELLVSAPASKRRKTVEWTGIDGEDAARRYIDCHRDATVHATRPANQHGLFVLGHGTIIG